MTRTIDIIAGARPNFMKISPIIRAMEAGIRAGSGLRYRLVHTGQHYDARMSGDFFDQLGIPHPHENLEVGSGSQAEQAGAIMVRYESLLMRAACDMCLVVGDVTSTMACAISARKSCIPVAHVEAGIRSGDWSMPEEVNRVVTDSLSSMFFTTSEHANDNLRRAGVLPGRIHFVGNTMIDTLLANESRFAEPDFWTPMALNRGEYLVLTLHRPSNVDDAGKFAVLLQAVCEAVRGRRVVFPVHPRTSKTLRALDRLPTNLLLVDPQPYLQFNFLVKHAQAVITDSGGITEETTVLGVPCMTLRTTTERPETVELGTNELLGTDPDAIRPALDRLFSGRWKRGSIPPLWDGRTGERIVSVLERELCQVPSGAAPK
jgi:UDP-N-acetylglucosamine 2-epimerase (non-hydrolysing)